MLERKFVTAVGHRIEREFGAPHPYYKVVVRSAPDGTVYTENVKRDMPEGISKHDQHVLKAVRKRAHHLEYWFSFIGIHLGWCAVVGIIPVVGAIYNIYMGIGTLRMAMGITGGLSPWIFTVMLANIVIDFALTFIPIVGSSFHAIYKSNARNAVVLDHYLRRRASMDLSSSVTSK